MFPLLYMFGPLPLLPPGGLTLLILFFVALFVLAHPVSRKWLKITVPLIVLGVGLYYMVTESVAYLSNHIALSVFIAVFFCALVWARWADRRRMRLSGFSKKKKKSLSFTSRNKYTVHLFGGIILLAFVCLPFIVLYFVPHIFGNVFWICAGAWWLLLFGRMVYDWHKPVDPALLEEPRYKALIEENKEMEALDRRLRARRRGGPVAGNEEVSESGSEVP